jgi:hypothetical protein
MRSPGCVIDTTYPVVDSGRPTEVNVTMPGRVFSTVVSGRWHMRDPNVPASTGYGCVGARN